MMKCLILCLCLLSSSFVVSSIKVENNAYQNIVIEIGKEVPRTNCLYFLQTLQNNLQAASEKLHSSLNERMYYGSFDIILPTDEWFDSCIGNGTFKNHNGAKSDVIISDTHEIFGDKMWTLQNQCGEEGEGIFMSYKNLLHQDTSEFPQRFNEEWLKYRYGVFDEIGFKGDDIFPQCSHSTFTSNATTTTTTNLLCQDALEIQSFDQRLFHNRFLPTKQNFKCRDQNKFDVIFHSNFDFTSAESHNTNNYEHHQQQHSASIFKTKFNFVKKALTRYVVIVEDHTDLSVRDSFQFLKDALRKWIEIDLDPNSSEVGIVMMKENQTNLMIDSKMKSIKSADNRDLLFSQLPWYIESSKGSQVRTNSNKCLLESYLEKSYRTLMEKSKFIKAENVIIVVAPGMYLCNDEESNRITADIEDAGIKLITINYPQIASNRVELDRLFLQTTTNNVETYTIFEEKQNEQQSLLNTFFDLSNVLMAISHAHSQNRDEMPVEIYRKKIGEDKNQLDSFNVDEATDDIQFLVYIYDRRERNIEKNFKLTSPSNKLFPSLTEQRAEYHQLGVLGKLNEVGSWNYNIKRFFSPQPTFIQVLAHPKQGQQFIRADAWIRKVDDHGNFIVYCKVFKGNTPINGAMVEMTVSLADHYKMKNNLMSFLLHDNGAEPDNTKHDGIYTKYLNLKKGVYKLDIVASSNGDEAYTQQLSDNEDVECCGSSINTQGRKRTVPSFHRYLRPMYVLSSETEKSEHETDYNNERVYARISDLKIGQVTNDSKVVLEITEPDVSGNFDPYQSNLFYEIWYTTNLIDIHDNLESACNKLELNMTLRDPGQRKSFVYDMKELSMIGRKVFIGVGIRDKSRQSLVSLSNVVGVFVKPFTSSAINGHNDSSDDSNGTNISIASSNGTDELLKANVILIVGLVFLCIVFALLICLCCLIRRKYKSKKKSDVTSAKQNISINVVSQPSMYEKVNQSYTTSENPKTFFANSTMLYDDHHDNGNNNLSYNIYDQQFPRNDNNPMIFDDASMLNTNDNNAALNSYDCWTASQLLNVHEKNNFMQLEVDKETDSIYNTKYPPISLSHHELYAGGGDVSNVPYATNNIGLPPPIYSSLRNYQADEYSPYYDKSKKIRNVTIV